MRIKTRNPRHKGRHQNFSYDRNNGMSRFTNSITAFRMTQPADTSIWPAIIFTRDNTSLGKLTVRRTIAFAGGDFRVLRRFNLISPFFTSVVQHSSVILSFVNPLRQRKKRNQSAYASSFSRSHHATIRVYNDASNVIETHEHKGDEHYREAKSRHAVKRAGRGALRSDK